MITPIGQVGMVLPTRIMDVRVRVIAQLRLEVIDICNLVTRGLGKRTPNLTTQSYMVKRSITTTRKRRGTWIYRT